MIKPEIRAEMEAIQGNLKLEMEKAKRLSEQTYTGIPKYQRHRLWLCIENAVEVFDEILNPEKYMD